MERQTALVLTIIIFILFLIICYYGARIRIWSSIAFATFVALILLNLFYPIGQVTVDQADYTLILYAIFEIIGILILAIYITHRSLGDIRNDYTCINS